MNSFPDLCYKLSEISNTLEPEHYFYFITIFGLVLMFEFLFQIINLILQISFKIHNELKLKKMSSQNVSSRFSK